MIQKADPSPSSQTQKRRAAFRLGLAGEAFAALYLRCKGYRILGERVRTHVGEIDLIALRGDTIAIVEVKARPSLTQALEAVTPRQQKRLGSAAYSWLARHPKWADKTVRFDIIAQCPRRLPVHVISAFEAWER